MKKILLVAFFALISMGVFGTTFSHNVDFGGYGFSLVASNVTIHEAMAGATYRYAYYPNDIGFYYGADVSVAFPTYSTAYYGTSVIGGNSMYSNALYLMMPFGYRWAGMGKTSGFYLGGGPSVQFIYGYDIEGIIGVGITSEFGFETNMTEGSQFHFAFQFGYSPGVFGSSRGYVGYGFSSALRFGISWRRIKSDS